MRILVPLKSIQDPAGLSVNRKAGRVFVNREERLMNPASKCALEAALRLKSATPAEVQAVTFGRPAETDLLCEARALGADRSILIEADPVDTAGVVKLLVSLIRHLGGVDLVVNGHRTLDTGLSSGAGLAEALGWPYLGETVDCALEGGQVRAVRRVHPHQVRFEAWSAPLPAVVTVTQGGPKPRYAHGGDIISAYRDHQAVELMTLVDLGMVESDIAPRTDLRGQSFPPEREFGRAATVAEVAALLKILPEKVEYGS
jgi:electron transfer flavoprotein beta subunit